MAVSTANSVARAVLTLHASVSFVHEQWALEPDNLVPLLVPAQPRADRGRAPDAALAFEHRTGVDALPALLATAVRKPSWALRSPYIYRSSPRRPGCARTAAHRRVLRGPRGAHGPHPRGGRRSARSAVCARISGCRLLSQQAVAAVPRQLACDLPGLAPRRTRLRALLRRHQRRSR